MGQRTRVIVIDDDHNFRRVISRELEDLGYSVESASRGREGVEKAKENAYDVVLLDIRMPGMDGIETLKALKEVAPDTEVIMLTAYGTLSSAVEAIKLGAYDYLTKPCKLDALEATLKRAYERKVLTKQNIVLRQELARRDRFVGIVGNSRALRSVLDLAQRVASTDSTVLIQGESGVGKELVARAIHTGSRRREYPFVVVDCGTLQESLLESELFGHEKGSYTGATSLKHGLFEVADLGSLFLDEIGEMSQAMQVNLLRVLETGLFRRVGGTKDIHVDVRIVAATNKDLWKETREGKFREDLYYRLNVVTITIPPLRERKEDIPLLVQHFLRYSDVWSGKEKRISREALSMLMSYHWPGNVRELKNVIERAIILSDGAEIAIKDLPVSRPEIPSSFVDFESESLPTLEEMEGKYIRWVLRKTDGHRGKTACILGIDPKTLYRKLLSLESQEQ